MKEKNGFISMTLVYTFLILFLFLMLGIMNAYTQKNKYLDAVDNKIKSDVNSYVYDNFNMEWLFEYTNHVQEFTVPETGYYKIELWGASGRATSGTAGGGAYTSGYIKLEKDKVLYIYVGEIAKNLQNGTTFNGGTSINNYWPGGGSTDIRLAEGTNWNDSSSIKTRIMVAGSGGICTGGASGNGGDIIGGDGSYGKGGTQKKSGVGLTSEVLSSIGISNGNYCLGGNGYYPGGDAMCIGSGSVNTNYGSGGGSSYISGYAGVMSINSSGATTSSTCYYDNNYYFIGGTMQAGENLNNNGIAKITYVGTSKPQRINVGLNNVKYIQITVTPENKKVMEIQAIKDGVNILNGISNASLDNNAFDGDITTGGSLSGSKINITLNSVTDLDEIAIWTDWTTSGTTSNVTIKTSSNGSTYTDVLSDNGEVTTNGKRISAYAN